MRRSHLDVYHMFTVALKNTTSRDMPARQTHAVGPKDRGRGHSLDTPLYDSIVRRHAKRAFSLVPLRKADMIANRTRKTGIRRRFLIIAQLYTAVVDAPATQRTWRGSVIRLQSRAGDSAKRPRATTSVRVATKPARRQIVHYGICC